MENQWNKHKTEIYLAISKTIKELQKYEILKFKLIRLIQPGRNANAKNFIKTRGGREVSNKGKNYILFN